MVPNNIDKYRVYTFLFTNDLIIGSSGLIGMLKVSGHIERISLSKILWLGFFYIFIPGKIDHI